MVLDKATIEAAVHNSVWVEEDENGLLYFRRFTPSQMEIYKQDILFCMMSRCQTGIYLLFQTTGDRVDLVVKKTSVLKMLPIILKEMGIPKLLEIGKDFKEQIQQYGDGRLYVDDAFDVFVDDKLIASPRPKSGRIRITFDNPGNELKTVKICFPVFAEIGIKEVKCNGKTKAADLVKERMYCFGDSITQGFVAGSPSCTYTSRIADALNLDALNQGIGGYYFMAESLTGLETMPVPKLITVAYGTNDWTTIPDMEIIRLNVRQYFSRLSQLFPNTPIYVITPIWRGDMEVMQPCGSFEDVIEVIENETSVYTNITVLDGLEISSHKTEDYADGWLHPNKEGFAIMAKGILERIDSSLTKHNGVII